MRAIPLLLILAPILSFGNGPPLILKLKEDVEVAGPEVLLKDVADIEAEDPIAERVGKIRICASPLPDFSRRIEASYISMKLRAFGMSPSEFRILGDYVNVRRRGRILRGDEIAGVAKDALSSRLEKDKSFFEIISKPSDMKIPEGKNVEVKVREKEIRIRPTGISYVPIDIIVDGKKTATVQVLARMEEEKDVLVLTRDVMRNEAIKEGDVRRIKARTSSLPPDPLTICPSDLSGIRAKRNLRAGQVLVKDMVEPIPLVKKGDRVTIRVELGGVRISAQGTAQEDGMLGDRIRVRRDGLQKDLICVVTGKGQTFIAVGGETKP